MSALTNRPTAAFIGASWTALLVGSIFYCIGLWNTSMTLQEKGYYLTILLYGLFAAVSLQKAVRDQIENIPVTSLYFILCWFSVIVNIALLAIGLWNAELAMSAKGFYMMSFLLALFGAIAVQKNIRDVLQHQQTTKPDPNFVESD